MDTMINKKISILIPCYNEEKSLPLLYDELLHITNNKQNKIEQGKVNYDWEFLFVNDGSKDNTLSIIKQLRENDNRVCYVDLSRNFGKEKAMLAGFDYVTGDCMIIMDADLQDPPSLIVDMLQYWQEGYDDIYAKRTTRGKESWLRKNLSLIFYRILKSTSRFDVLENVGDFRLLDRSCIQALRNLRETERYTKGLFAWIGFRKKEILFERGDRVAGNSSWKLNSLFGLAIEGITSFTIVPLKISSFIGSIVSLWAFIYLIWILIKTLMFGDDVQGYPTLMITILMLGGLQLLTIGVLGEYLGRIFNETKNRPTYIAREYNGKKIIN